MANLASVILEGANLMSSSIDTSDYDYSDLVVTESSYFDSAVATLFTDIMEAEQEFMVADVVGAATIIRESALGNTVDAVAVTEGVIKNGIEKIKNAFKKFLAKIKDYYHKIISWFKAMFSNAEDFVKNYGDEVKTKASKVKGFTYKGYKYTLEKGNNQVESIKSEIDKAISGYLNGFDFVNKITGLSSSELLAELKISKDFKEDGKPSATEVVDKFLEDNFKYSDIAEMNTELRDLFRDGDTEKKEIKDFEENSVSEMLTFLKTSSKTINKFETELSKHEGIINKVINKLNGIKIEDEKSDNLINNISYISSIVTSYLNAYKAACNVRITANKDVASDYLSVLKKFYSYKYFKGVKEAFIPTDEYPALESSYLFESDDVEEEDDDEGGCKKKKGCATEEGCATKEGCTESAIASILEQASRFSL